MVEPRDDTAVARWQRAEDDVERRETDAAPPTLAYDGVYAGTATMRADGRVAIFLVKVVNGIGSGTQKRLDCGTAPLSLRISSWGEVRGLVLIFGSTCLKTEMLIRGRAVDGSLLLRLGSQFVEFTKRD